MTIRLLRVSIWVLPVGFVTSAVQAMCPVNATVLAEGQPLSGVSVSFRQAQNPFTTVGETGVDGRISFETTPLQKGILMLAVHFQREGFEPITRLLWRKSDVDQCPAQNLGSLTLEQETTSQTLSVGPGGTDGEVPSAHGRTLYVAPYEVYPAANSAEKERLNAIFDRVLINHILSFRTALRLQNPPAEISVEKLNNPVSLSNAERIRGLGAALNALGIITGEGEVRAIQGGQLYVDLVSEFRVIPFLQSSREHRVQIQDNIPSGDLRVRPETLCRITEFSEHESNGRELDEGERVAVEVLPVLGQSAAAVEPGDGAFDHPTPGLDDEALHPIGSLDDLGLEIGQDAGQGAVKDRALIGAVGEQFPEKGKQTEQGRQQRETAVAILNVGGGDDAVQQQALRIDQNMPLLALDQLAGIEAVAVDASPPFSALFTL